MSAQGSSHGMLPIHPRPPGGPSRPPGGPSQQNLAPQYPALPEDLNLVERSIHYLLSSRRYQPTKKQPIPTAAHRPVSAAWVVDTDLPALIGSVSTQMPPPATIRARLDYLATGPYEQEGPWIGASLDIPIDNPEPENPATYRDKEDNNSLTYHTVSVKFYADSSVTVTRLSPVLLDNLKNIGVVDRGLHDVVEITFQAAPGTKATTTGLSWPLVRNSSFRNNLLRNDDPFCRQISWTREGRSFSISLDSLVSNVDVVRLLVPTGLAFGRLHAISRVLQWFGQIVPYRPFVQTDLTKWNRKIFATAIPEALAARPGIYEATARFSTFKAWATQAAIGPINQIFYMLPFVDAQRDLALDGYFVKSGPNDVHFMLGVRIQPPSDIVPSEAIWTNIRNRLMGPGEEVRVYFKPWGKAPPSRKKKDKYFWKAVVVEVPDTWKTKEYKGHFNLALKVSRPPVIQDERGADWKELRLMNVNASESRPLLGKSAKIYLRFVPGEGVTRREIAGIQRIQPFNDKQGAASASQVLAHKGQQRNYEDSNDSEDDNSTTASDDEDEDEAAVYDPKKAARVKLAIDSMDNQLQRDLFQGAGFSQSAFFHDWRAGVPGELQPKLLSLLHPDYRVTVPNYLRRVGMGYATISGPAGSTKSSVLVVAGLMKVAAGRRVSAGAPSNMAASNLVRKAINFQRQISWLEPLVVRLYPVHLEATAVLAMFVPRTGARPKEHDLLSEGLHDEEYCSPDSRGVWSFDYSVCHRTLQVLAINSQKIGGIDIGHLRPVNPKLIRLAAELREPVIIDLVRYLSSWNTGTLPDNYHARCSRLDKYKSWTPELMKAQLRKELGPLIRRLMKAIVATTDFAASTIHTLRDPFYRGHNNIANAYLLDEASMLRQSQANSVMRLSRPTAAAGDNKQLGLVNQLEYVVDRHGQNLDPFGHQLSHLDKLIKSGMPICYLSSQVRAAPGTNDLVHEIYYPSLHVEYASGNTITSAQHPFTGPSEAWANAKHGVRPSPNGKVWPVFVQCTTAGETACVQHSTLSKSNAPMRRVMFRVLDDYIRHLRRQGVDIRPQNIQIIVAYAAELEAVQQDLLVWEQHLRPPTAPGAARELIPSSLRACVSTAGKFQGWDREVVVFLTTADHSSGLGFVADPQRVCTGSSRHKDFFICIGDERATRDSRNTTINQYYNWFRKDDVKNYGNRRRVLYANQFPPPP